MAGGIVAHLNPLRVTAAFLQPRLIARDGAAVIGLFEHDDGRGRASVVFVHGVPIATANRNHHLARGSRTRNSKASGCFRKLR
jgi:hypothetical protein